MIPRQVMLAHPRPVPRRGLGRAPPAPPFLKNSSGSHFPSLASRSRAKFRYFPTRRTGVPRKYAQRKFRRRYVAL